MKGFISAGYYYIYNSFINASSFYVLIESNSGEVREFIHSFTDTWIISLFVMTVIPVPFIIKEFKNQRCLKFNLTVGAVILVAPILWTFFISKSLPYVSISGFYQYQEEARNYEKSEISNPIGSFENVSHTVEGKELHVIIIGESTSRDHLNIYGYNRPTTPNLAAIQNKLSIYTDVISPHTHTIAVLSKLLTLSNYENPKEPKGSIIQLINQAGYKTYWISNQKPVGIFDNQVTLMARATNQQVFINTTSEQRRTPLDLELIPELKKVIEKDEEKVVVFLHILGTHTAYDQRYPNDFERFEGKPELTQHRTDRAYETINEYDNAVLYNDFVVSEVIDVVAKVNTNSFVLYFSDHGEDVFQVSNNAIHVETKATSPMFRVPFVLWQSLLNESKRKIDKELDRKYMLDDLFHGIADLCEIKFLKFDSTRSIFNKNFRPRERVILDGITYEELLQSEK
ncbi:MAG: sulfatase-like hydrolase/transferase [Reichenbachiella sp.]